jgi:hypothetical protein
MPHFDSPEQAHEHRYGEDGHGFNIQPDRRMLCRPAASPPTAPSAATTTRPALAAMP